MFRLIRRFYSVNRLIPNGLIQYLDSNPNKRILEPVFKLKEALKEVEELQTLAKSDKDFKVKNNFRL